MPNPSTAYVQARLRLARLAVEQLTPAQRAVLTLGYLDGWTLADIAAARPEDQATVQQHLDSGLRQLQMSLAAVPMPPRRDPPEPPARPPSRETGPASGSPVHPP